MSTFFEKIQNNLPKLTFQSVHKIALFNAKKNLKYLNKGKSIIKIKNYSFKKKTNNALIVSGGPSLRIINHIKQIKRFEKKLIIICTDGSLFYLLENNIIPDLLVCLDPHPTRIIRWFGDENLNKKKLLKDNYFRSQDIDVKFKNEINKIKKILFLTKKFGKHINTALCTSAPDNVVKRLIKIKSKIFWWNPYLDDDDIKGSLSKKLYKINNLPLINSGGNVGSACWMIASNVLGCKNIAMIGMDFSYYENTKLEQTQYYGILKENFGKKYIEKFYKKIFNPIYKKYLYTDYVYNWYKNIFLDMISDTKSNTFNCTEGGILFGKNIRNMKLKDFLKKYI